MAWKPRSPLALPKSRNHFRYCSPFVEIWILLCAHHVLQGRCSFLSPASPSAVVFVFVVVVSACLTRKSFLGAKLDEIDRCSASDLLLFFSQLCVPWTEGQSILVETFVTDLSFCAQFLAGGQSSCPKRGREAVHCGVIIAANMGCYRKMEGDASLFFLFSLSSPFSLQPAPTNPCSLRLHSLIWCSCRSVRAVASRYLANWRWETAVGLRSRL